MSYDDDQANLSWTPGPHSKLSALHTTLGALDRPSCAAILCSPCENQSFSMKLWMGSGGSRIHSNRLADARVTDFVSILKKLSTLRHYTGHFIKKLPRIQFYVLQILWSFHHRFSRNCLFSKRKSHLLTWKHLSFKWLDIILFFMSGTVRCDTTIFLSRLKDYVKLIFIFYFHFKIFFNF